MADNDSNMNRWHFLWGIILVAQRFQTICSAVIDEHSRVDACCLHAI